MKVYYTEMATIGDSHKVVDPRKKWEKTPDINYILSNGDENQRGNQLAKRRRT